MNKLLIVTFTATLAGLTGTAAIALAHSASVATAAIAESVLQEETVTSGELGVAEPTLLPSSPFYFFKNVTRTIRRVFTLNPIARAELELRFADETIAEAKKLADTSPERIQAIERAVGNYQDSQERLRGRLEALKETSANPNVDRLLEKLADRTVKHEKLFAELKEQFEARAELKSALDAANIGTEESLAAAAKKDEVEKFARKIEKALSETKGSDLRHVRSLEIIDRIHQKADPELREKLSDLREDFTERLREGIETFVGEGGADAPETLREVLEKLPGDKARRLVVLEELRERAAERAKGALEGAAEAIEEEVEKREELAERAGEAIRHARERIEKLTQAMTAVSTVPEAVTRLFREATGHLERAVKAFEEKKYGEAFGQARAAEVIARNGLRILERERPEDRELKEKIAELDQKLNAAEKRISGLNPELQPKANEALESSRFHLRLAAETLAKGELKESKRHLEEAKHFFRTLERIFHAARKSEVKPMPRPEWEAGQGETQKREEFARCGPRPLAPGNWVCRDGSWKLVEERKLEPVVCTQEYSPVCGFNGKTYPNACHARVAGVAVKYRGECGKSEEKPMLRIEPAPPPAEAPREPAPPPTTEPTPPTSVLPEPVWLKIEADDRGFYPQNVVSVPKGVRVAITFAVRTENVYFGGLDFRSPKFKTESVKPGGSTQVEFTADEPFTITSYWPASGVRKADLRVEVK